MDIFFFFFLSKDQINILNEHICLFLAGLPYILMYLEFLFGGGGSEKKSLSPEIGDLY